MAFFRSIFQPKKLLSLLLICSFPVVSLPGCSQAEESQIAGDYGTSSMNFAFRFAHDFPYRSPYSEVERQAEARILEELKKLGYAGQQMAFSGQGGVSNNIVVNLPGKGFYRDPIRATDVAGAEDATLAKGDFRRTIIVGAHYDSFYSAQQEAEAPQYDGVSDNASGVAVLLSLLEQLKNQRIGYDVAVVFFGAGTDQHQGARAYLNSLSEEQRANVDAVFVVESLYGGDKLYANAGPASASKEKLHRLRTPLYDLLNISVSNYTGLRLYDNQNGGFIQPEGWPEQVVYREFTLRPGDYIPFDEAGMPVVYIESADYSGADAMDFRESKNPQFSATGGKVRNTAFDNLNSIKEALKDDQFSMRLNAITFLLSEYIKNGYYDAEVKG